MFIPYFKDPTDASAASLAHTLALVSDINFHTQLPADLESLNDVTGCWQDIPTQGHPPTDIINAAIAALDRGASKVVIGFTGTTMADLQTLMSDVLSSLPADRTIVRFEFTERVHVEFVDAVAAVVGGVIVRLGMDVSPFESDAEGEGASARRSFERQQGVNLLKQLVTGLSPDGFQRRLVVETPHLAPTCTLVAKLDKMTIDLLVPSDAFLRKGGLDAAEAFTGCLVTDRTDGLFPTMVVDEQRVGLGLAYSSVKSVAETIRTGQGVYQSRTRGLWYKGLTSGATQAVRKIQFDCDKDTLQFV
ncbi:trifunctional histidinol dehydrogenase, partial [Dinochytrium kinnereticum]